MTKIKIQFSDFWGGFDAHNNFWTLVLNKLDIPFEIVSDNSDLLISSCFGNSFLTRKTNKKMYWTGENWYRMNTNIPQIGGSIINIFDMVYSFDVEEYQNHYRLPLYLVDTIESEITDYNKICRLLTKDELNNLFQQKKFCTFVQANHNSEFRNNYFHLLNKISNVDSYGPLFNNTGQILNRQQKINITNNYKFQLSFENSKYEGYITEKLIDALKSDIIPIYWGGDINNEFNTKAIIDVNSLGVENSFKLITELKSNFDLYWEWYNQPIIRNDQTPLVERIEAFYSNFKNFISSI
jgi:hypothetical protein